MVNLDIGNALSKFESQYHKRCINYHYSFSTKNCTCMYVKYIHLSVSIYLFTLECISGYYGNNCSYQCSVNCNVTKNCDKSTGQCEGGCKPGWTGDTCDQGKCFTIMTYKYKTLFSLMWVEHKRNLNKILLKLSSLNLIQTKTMKPLVLSWNMKIVFNIKILFEKKSNTRFKPFD